MPKKLTFEFVKSKFEERGYELLEKEYKNAHAKLKYICPVHPDKELNISYNKLSQGRGCPFCANNVKCDFVEVKKEFEERGYILLEKEYINTNHPMRYQCPHHPNEETYISRSSLLSGSGCGYCAGNVKLEYEEVKNEFINKNYELISNEYINNKTDLDYRCLKHPEFIQKIPWDRFKMGNGCVHCWNERRIIINSGENSSFWKGGVTTLHIYLRSRLNSWKKDSMKKCNYKCVITGDKFDDIHHLYSFSRILEEVISELNIEINENIANYTSDEIKIIEEKCLEIHYRYPFGICLRRDVHNLFHSIYGKLNNTPEQFEEFKQRYISGEFNKILHNVS